MGGALRRHSGSQAHLPPGTLAQQAVPSAAELVEVEQPGSALGIFMENAEQCTWEARWHLGCWLA